MLVGALGNDRDVASGPFYGFNRPGAETIQAVVDNWWRQRARMTLVRAEGKWKVEGPGAERARVAYATVAHDKVVYRVC